ncbi:MAG: flagellar basal-body MS-ring/collar protein FliF [Buchnera aphidicola (Schlechtendalia peitan)]
MNVGVKHKFNVKDKNKKPYFSLYALFNVRTIIAISSILSIIIFFLFVFKSSNYHILYNSLSNEDEKLIISQLTRMNIPFKFSDDHKSLLVPENQIRKIQENLFEQGLPKGNSIGFELLDQEKFGISQFNEQINYQRALEGELARSIQQLDNVKTARVHIALPKPSLFVQDSKLPSASIILGIKDGLNINSSQINAILHMVSGSISGLPIENITIIDHAGRLLNSDDSFDSNIDNTRLKYYDLIEEHYKKRIENILIPLVGPNNVHAQVTAQINFDKKESTEEKYKPNYSNDSKSIRSHHSSSNTELNEKYIDGSIPSNSFSNKMKNFSKKLSSDAHNTNHNLSEELSLNNSSNKNFENVSILPKSSLNQDYIVNYELDHTIFHSKFQIGDIKRLSAAVVINYVRDKNGELVSLSPYQIKRIEHLIQESIGFSSERGDTISVVSALFMKPPVNIYKSVSFWNQPLFLNMLFKYGLPVFFAIIIIYLLYRIFFSKKVIVTNKLDNNGFKNTSENNKNIVSTTIGSSKGTSMNEGFNNLSKNDPHTIVMIIREWMGGNKK